MVCKHTDKEVCMNKLKKERIKIISKIKSLDDIIKGSIYEMKRFCGKKNCKCIRTNTPHKSLFLSYRYEGKTQLIPIKKEQVLMVKKKIQKYKELKKAIDKLAMINSKLLKYE